MYWGESTSIQHKETLDLQLQWTVAADTDEETSEDLSMFTAWSPTCHQGCEHVCNNVRDALGLENVGFFFFVSIGQLMLSMNSTEMKNYQEREWL